MVREMSLNLAEQWIIPYGLRQLAYPISEKIHNPHVQRCVELGYAGRFAFQLSRLLGRPRVNLQAAEIFF
jgi:hypothetical protein